MRLSLGPANTSLIRLSPGIMQAVSACASSASKGLCHILMHSPLSLSSIQRRKTMGLPPKTSGQVSSYSYAPPVLCDSRLLGKLMATVVDLPRPVVIALGHAIKHLSDFSIADAFVETNFFNRFTTRAHMLLNGNTLLNLYLDKFLL